MLTSVNLWIKSRRARACFLGNPAAQLHDKAFKFFCQPPPPFILLPKRYGIFLVPLSHFSLIQQTFLFFPPKCHFFLDRNFFLCYNLIKYFICNHLWNLSLKNLLIYKPFFPILHLLQRNPFHSQKGLSSFLNLLGLPQKTNLKSPFTGFILSLIPPIFHPRSFYIWLQMWKLIKEKWLKISDFLCLILNLSP